MIFPSVADIVLATPDATFGFPEIRRGVLPSVVSVHARRRLNDRQCRRFMLTGHTFDVSDGISMGFVDQLLPPDDAESFLQSIMQRLTSLDNLCAYKAITGA